MADTCNRLNTEEGQIFLQTEVEYERGQTARHGYFARLKTDTVFRHRLIHTFVLYWSFITVGWAIGMAGPAFPDLRQIVQVDLATASWLFTVGSTGYMIGAILFGILFDRLNRHLLFAVCTFGFAVFNAVKPYCSLFPAMMAVQLVGYIFCGGLDTGGNSDIPYIWGAESGPYMQALHLAFCVGAILAPLATEPFLAKKLCVVQNNNQTNDSLTYQEQGMSNYSVLDDTKCQYVYEETNVHYAFILSAIISLSGTFGYLYLYCKFSDVYTSAAGAKQPKGSKQDDSGDVKPKGHRMPFKLKVVFLILLSLLLMTYCIVEDEFGNYLMTFSIIWLGWSKEKGSFATTLHWACFVLGRFLGIFLVNCCKQRTILTIFILFLAMSVTGFWLGSRFRVVPVIWIFTGCMGLSMSVIVPSIFSWTSENVIQISGKISAVFLVSASTGVMFFPILAGYLMENYTPLWFVYILMIVMFCNLAVYIFIRTLTRIYITNKYRTTEISLVKSENITLTEDHHLYPILR